MIEQGKEREAKERGQGERKGIGLMKHDDERLPKHRAKSIYEPSDT